MSKVWVARWKLSQFVPRPCLVTLTDDFGRRICKERHGSCEFKCIIEKEFKTMPEAREFMDNLYLNADYTDDYVQSIEIIERESQKD